MAFFSRSCNTFFSRIVSVCAVDGKKKKVLGAAGIVNQFLQICLDYSSLPPLNEMSIEDIHFFYGARIKELCKMQKD